MVTPPSWVLADYPGRRHSAHRILGAAAVREAAKIHRDVDLAGDECPSVAALIEAGKLDAKRSTDPWHTAYEVRCEDADVRGVSYGADRRPRTADDVRDDVTPADVERIAKMSGG